jgi:hypothetical protein
MTLSHFFIISSEYLQICFFQNHITLNDLKGSKTNDILWLISEGAQCDYATSATNV